MRPGTTTKLQGDTTHVAVKIRLKRMGKIRQPYYRVVVVDSRKKRDGKVIEEIGKYHPKEEPSFIEVTSDRAQYWLGVGAQPSEAVEAILKITGDWQTFKGLPGTEGTLRHAEPKRDKTELFNEALKDAAKEPKAGATTAKKAAAKKAAAPEKSAEPTAEAGEQQAATEQVEEAVAETGSNPAEAATTEQAATESGDGSAETDTEAKADPKSDEA